MLSPDFLRYLMPRDRYHCAILALEDMVGLFTGSGRCVPPEGPDRKQVRCGGLHMHPTLESMSLLIALFLVLGVSTSEAQWVMAARAAKNRIERMTQKSDKGGYDVATVILEATPTRVYDKAIKTLKAHPEITITKDDSKTGKIQFRKGQQVAGLQISPLGDDVTQLVIASNIGETVQPGTSSLVLDAVLRICKEVNVQCTVQPD